MKILLGLLSLMTLTAPLASNVTFISTTPHQQEQTFKNLATSSRSTSSLSVTGLNNETIMSKYSHHGNGTTNRNSGFKAIGTIMYSDFNLINPPKNLNDLIVNQHFTSFSFQISPIVNSSAAKESWRATQNISLSISADDIKPVNNTNLWGDSNYLLTATGNEQVQDWWSYNKDSLPREAGWFWHCYNKTTGKSNDNYLFLVAREVVGGITFGFVGQDRLGAGDNRYRNGGLRMNGATTINIKQTSNTGFDLNYLQNSMKETYSFQSKTSTDLNSPETRSIIDNQKYASNATYIQNEFDRRIRDSLGSDFNGWSNLVKYNINNLSIDNNAKEASYSFYGLPSNSNFPSTLKMPVKVTFDKKGLTGGLRSVFEKTFEFESDMSSNISNTQTNSTTQRISNYQLVLNEIKMRLNLLLGNHKDDWGNKIKFSTSFDDSTNKVTISFTDSSGMLLDSGGRKFEVIMPCQIDLSDGYNNRSIEKRMHLEGGRIADPSSKEGGLVQDSPSYERGSGTDGGVLTYHSAVDLTFDSMTDNSEKLYINGKPQDLINNKFSATLDSKPFDSDSDGNEAISYDIAVKNNTSTKLTLKVKIASVASSIGFTWEGWHPDEKGDAESKRQWLLTQPKIFDDKNQQIDNPAYNPLIDTKTGLIEQNVFIKTSGAPKYPFPIDPLDKNGEEITYTEQLVTNQATKYIRAQNEKANWMYGYIAQAMVSQMGTSFTNDLNGLAIDHVDRVQLNPDDFSEKGSPVKVDLTKEANFSSVGLWHYIIYLDNKVSGKPLDPTNLTDAQTIKATQGSTINKLVYITGSGNENKYQSFTDLDFAKKDNANVTDFWNTIQSRHLKEYLKIMNFTGTDFETIDYEHLMTYWNNYVQDVVRHKNVPSQDSIPNLDDQTDMPKILMNQVTDEGIKKKIRDEVQKYLTSINSEAVYNIDYIITDSINGTIPLESLDVSNLEQTESNGYSASGKLVIKSKFTSMKLEGTKIFNILNAADIEEDKVLDLTKIPFPDEQYNFSNISPVFLTRQYIDLYIHNILVQNRFAGDYQLYTYGKDYEVTINDFGVDYKQDNSGASALAISNFLTTDDASLKITIKAINSSTKMVGTNSYTMTNSKDAPTPPMVKTDIATIFVNTNLGEFGINDAVNGFITKQQIWDRLLEVNKIDLDDPNNIYQDLVIDNFNFLVLQSGVDANQVPLYKAWIMTKATDANYTGGITATYTSLVPPVPNLSKLDINEIFLNKDLGELVDTNGNGYIDKEEIWTKLLSINNATNYPDLIMSDFRILAYQKDATNYYARVDALPSSKNYQGRVTITYTSQFPPNPDDPDLRPDDDNKATFNKINLAWIIPVVLLALGGIITGLYFWFRHRKTKKKMR